MSPSVQLALRLLITSSSRLLELEDIRSTVGPFDRNRLVYPWSMRPPDGSGLRARLPRCGRASETKAVVAPKSSAAIWSQLPPSLCLENFDLMPRAAIPYLDEPWYC